MIMSGRTREIGRIDEIEMIYPADSLMPVPTGRWHRLSDGRIKATYKYHELKVAVEIGKVFEEQRKIQKGMKYFETEADDWL